MSDDFLDKIEKEVENDISSALEFRAPTNKVDSELLNKLNLEYVTEKLKSQTLFDCDYSEGQIYTIDEFLRANVGSLLETLSEKEFTYAISNLKSKMQYSWFNYKLEECLIAEGMEMLFSFKKEKAQAYARLGEINYKLGYTDYYFPLALGLYYYDKDKNLSLKYYKSAFDNGLPFEYTGYYKHLENYLSLLSNPLEVINNLLERKYDYDFEDDFYNYDYLCVQMKKIELMDKQDVNYLQYLTEVVCLASRLVNDFQYDRKMKKSDDFDTELERAHCKLISLHFEYFVENEDFDNATKAYRNLTDAIKFSKCISFNKVKDELYKKLKLSMKK